MSETMEAAVMGTEAQAEWVSRVLGIDLSGGRGGAGSGPGPVAPGVAAGAGAGAGEPARPVSLVAFAKLRLDWEGAKKAVEADLGKLRRAIEGEYSGDPLVEAVEKLDAVLGRFNSGLGDRLDDIANGADGAARAKAAAGAQAIAEDYASYLMDDPLVDLIEINPFMDILISGRLGDVLERINGALGRMQGA